MKNEYVHIRKSELERLLKELTTLKEEFERLRLGSGAMDQTKKKELLRS